MILHEYKGWAITHTDRWVHMCHPLGATCEPGDHYWDNYGISMQCTNCQAICPQEVDEHIVRLRKFIKSAS